MKGHRGQSGWTAWLPFLRRGGSADAPAAAAEGRPGRNLARLAHESRRDLLEGIARFHIEHDLAVCPTTLIAAYEAVSGASPNLARRIEGRKRAGEPVTRAWLQEVSDDTGSEPDHRESRRLIEEFDTTLEQFAHNTRAVRSMTREYGSEIGRHLDDLDRVGSGADILAQLTRLAQVMAERTHKAEANLREREQETKRLRRRLSQLQREADHDHLTGLPNRRAFEVQLDRAFEEAQSGGQPLSLAFCDLDHFKQVNDRHGHETGDRVLKLVAQELAAACDDECHVSRHGGEEFVLLFRGATIEEAASRLDHTREALARRRLINRETEEPIGHVTFSAGIADVLAYDSPRCALRAADEALLRAKEAGRNRVVLASAPEEEAPRAAA